MLKRLKKREGFTLIEIVFVLAIAALILVIVFLAVSGAQKSQRDTARKDYVNRLTAAVVNQYSNNNSSWDCTVAANTAILNNASNIDKPNLGGTTPTVSTGAASITNVNVAGTTTTCVVSVTLETGGTYSKTATP